MGIMIRSRTLTPVPPCQIRAENRQAKNNEIWDDPVYQTIQESFLQRHPTCIRCGKPSEVAHHRDYAIYGTVEYYNLDKNADPYCRTCHEIEHKNLERCPICGGPMLPGRDCCSRCESDEIKTARKIKRKKLQDAVNRANKAKYRKWKRKATGK